MQNKYKENELVNNGSLTQAQKILIDTAETLKEAWQELADIAKAQADSFDKQEAKAKEESE